MDDFLLQNRYLDDFFYIFLSLFSLSPLRTAEITTPRHSFTTFTTAYTASIYPTPALRLVTWSTTESGTTRETIRLLYFASRYPHINYKYSHCSARKRRKTTHPRSPVIMPPPRARPHTTLPFADQLSEPPISSTAEWRLPTHTAPVRQNFCHWRRRDIWRPLHETISIR